jgi:hypothetical protein
MRVGVTATQRGLNPRQLAEFELCLRQLHATELHHGDCVGGDAQLHDVARRLGLRVVGHPPDNMSKRAHCQCDELRVPRPYLDRNHDIVDETEVLLAGPKDTVEELRSGTWATVRYARKRGKQVHVVWPV